MFSVGCRRLTRVPNALPCAIPGALQRVAANFIDVIFQRPPSTMRSNNGGRRGSWPRRQERRRRGRATAITSPRVVAGQRSAIGSLRPANGPCDRTTSGAHGGWCLRGVVARRPQDNGRWQSSLDGEVEGALSELRRVDEATAAQQAGGLPPSRRASSSWTGGRLVSRELRTTAAPGRRRRRQQRLRVTTTAAATAARPTATRPRHYQSQQYSLLLKGE